MSPASAFPPSLDALRAELRGGLGRALLASDQGLELQPAETAADSILRGQGLPESTVSRFGDRPVCTLVSFDADHIQRWVFASERVQVAKGASLTLDRLNREVPDAIVAKGIGIQGIVYSAGGGGMFVAAATERPAELESHVRLALEAESHDLTFTVVSVPLFVRDLVPAAAPQHFGLRDPSALARFARLDGLPGALIRLQAKLREAKDARPRLGGPSALTPRRGVAADRCPSCGRRPRQVSDGPGDGPDTWCSWCSALREVCLACEKRGRGARPRSTRSLTFSELAEASSRRRKYLGFVAIDGNGMGRIVESVSSLLELRAFSDATTWVYQRARARVADVLSRGYLATGWDPDDCSLSLLSGGDEVALVMPAAPALPAAREVLKSIEKGFDELVAPDGLLREAFAANPDALRRLARAGASGGTVLAHANYPVRLLRRYADKLQKDGKAACAIDAGSSSVRSALAWEVLTDSSPLVETAFNTGSHEDLSLDAFDRLLAEAEAVEHCGVPKAAIQRLVAYLDEEDLALRCVGDSTARGLLVAHLGANFFRYQLARNRHLASWCQRVGSEKNQEVDEAEAISRWFETGGGRRLRRLLDLMSLQPLPSAVGALP